MNLRTPESKVLGYAFAFAIALTMVGPSDVAHARGIKARRAPVAGEPIRCFSPGDDVYCLMPSGVVQGLSNQRRLIAVMPAPGFYIAQMMCDVDHDDRAICFYVEQRNAGTRQKPNIHSRLMHVDSGAGQLLISEGYSANGYGVSARGIYIRNGRQAAAWSVQLPGGTQHFISDHSARHQVELPEASFASTLIDLTSDRQQESIQFFAIDGQLWAIGRSGNHLEAGRVGAGMVWMPLPGSSMYDFRTVVAADGYVYVFYYDPDSNSAMVATTRDGRAWSPIELDAQESGWQLDAAPVGYGVVATWYFFRNTYNKGLRTAFLRGGQLLQEANTITRRGDRNTGWHPHLGVTRDGTTWVSWWYDVDSKQRVWSRLRSPLDLAESPAPDFEDWRDDYKFWYLQAGFGSWYTFWNTEELELDAKDSGGVSVGKSKRELGNSLLMTGMFEARLASMQLALGYAQSIVDSANERTGGKLQSLLGSVKFDSLFLGHDIQVRGALGHYEGSATPGSNADASGTGPLDVDTTYWEAQALALNKWRIKYGLSYARYELPVTLHAFVAPAGQTAYGYTDSYFRNVAFDDIRFIIGYSKLDYVARYENHYSDFVVDAQLLGGVALMHFDAVEVAPNERSTFEAALSVGAHLELGWLWVHRLSALAGLGLFVRPVYRADFDLISGFGKPEPRDADAAMRVDSQLDVALVSVRHGPWIEAGLVW